MKKLIAYILVLCMAVSFSVGCGKQSKEPAEKVTNTPTASVTEKPTPEPTEPVTPEPTKPADDADPGRTEIEGDSDFADRKSVV